jgi:hypothetical protein
MALLAGLDIQLRLYIVRYLDLFYTFWGRKSRVTQKPVTNRQLGTYYVRAIPYLKYYVMYYRTLVVVVVYLITPFQ